MNECKQAQLNDYLNDLRLPTARRYYPDSTKRARKDNWEHEEYLLDVVRQESEARKIRRIERRLRQSCLSLEKSLDSFELKRLPNKVRQQLKVILEGSFLKHNENILVFGNPGSGKTHLVSAIGQELIRQDKRIYFTSCALLLQKLLAAKRDLTLPRLLKKLNRYHAIIIDDIGYVNQAKEEMEVLFTLLAERYERGSVMITSNLAFSKWERIFKDPVMTSAAIDRIVHHSLILELNISSYRMRTAKTRNKQKRR